MKQRRVHVKDGESGRELIVDGTFASFYRPGSAVTGSVWDAIAAGALALPPVAWPASSSSPLPRMEPRWRGQSLRVLSEGCHEPGEM